MPAFSFELRLGFVRCCRSAKTWSARPSVRGSWMTLASAFRRCHRYASAKAGRSRSSSHVRGTAMGANSRPHPLRHLPSPSTVTSSNRAGQRRGCHEHGRRFYAGATCGMRAIARYRKPPFAPPPHQAVMATKLEVSTMSEERCRGLAQDLWHERALPTWRCR